jgi:class 3 adenylate cyclase
LLLLLLEAIWEGTASWIKPDVYVLLVMTLGQSAGLAWRKQKSLTQPWWIRLVGLVFYALVESLIEGPSFFLKPKHVTFACLTLAYAWGAALEASSQKPLRALAGIVLSRTAQGLGPLLFYVALDLREEVWLPGLMGFFNAPGHTFLLALTLTQVGSLIALALLGRRQRQVIADLLHQLKDLSRWGFGSRVVEAVLRDSGTRAASRVERAIGFIDVRGFTAWSESHSPEEVIELLNRFYALVLQTCEGKLIKSKMSGDEVLLVLRADTDALSIMQAALRAALLAVQPLQLSAGAGLWIGPVVEGFFGAQEAPVHDVIGDTVNTAKRLCDHAQGGQLLAGPVARLSDGAMATTSIQAKGKNLPVQAALYTVVG